MKPKIDHLEAHSHDAVVLALFGSYENYRNSPLLKDVNDRIAYLTKVKIKVTEKVQSELEVIQWWNIYLRIVSFLSIKIAIPNLIKEADELLCLYQTQRALPVKFFVDSINEDFDKFQKNWDNVILISGVEIYKGEQS